MNRFSLLTDFDHIVKWQMNLTNVLVLVLAACVVWKTDVIEWREQTEEQGNEVEVAVEGPI